MSLFLPNIPDHPTLDGLQSLVCHYIGRMGGFFYSFSHVIKGEESRVHLSVYILPLSQYLKKGKKDREIGLGSLVAGLGTCEVCL